MEDLHRRPAECNKVAAFSLISFLRKVTAQLTASVGRSTRFIQDCPPLFGPSPPLFILSLQDKQSNQNTPNITTTTESTRKDCKCHDWGSVALHPAPRWPPGAGASPGSSGSRLKTQKDTSRCPRPFPSVVLPPQLLSLRLWAINLA